MKAVTLGGGLALISLVALVASASCGGVNPSGDEDAGIGASSSGGPFGTTASTGTGTGTSTQPSSSGGSSSSGSVGSNGASSSGGRRMGGSGGFGGSNGGFGGSNGGFGGSNGGFGTGLGTFTNLFTMMGTGRGTGMGTGTRTGTGTGTRTGTGTGTDTGTGMGTGSSTSTGTATGTATGTGSSTNSGTSTFTGTGTGVCASPDTPIATPTGDRAIADIRAGDVVYSVDHEAIRPVVVVRVSKTRVTHHYVMRVRFESGRVLEISAGHPTADGRFFSELVPGARLDGHAIQSVEPIPYAYEDTYDILPASDTGTYFAAGMLIGSTLTREILTDSDSVF